MNKTDAHPEGENPLAQGAEKTPLSDAEARLLERLGGVSEFGIEALHAKFKEKGLISTDDSQKP